MKDDERGRARAQEEWVSISSDPVNERYHAVAVQNPSGVKLNFASPGDLAKELLSGNYIRSMDHPIVTGSPVESAIQPGPGEQARKWDEDMGDEDIDDEDDEDDLY